MSSPDRRWTDTELRTFLGEVPLFATLGVDALDAIASSLQRRKVAAGEWLFRQGDDGDALFLVRSGRLEIVNESDADTVVGLLDRGSWLGELALLTGGVRAAGARALRDSELLVLGRARFHELLSGSVDFVLALTSSLGAQLQRAGMTAVLPPRRRSVLAVVTPDPGLAATELCRALGRGLSACGHTAVLTLDDFPGAMVRDQVDTVFGARLDEAERSHDVVVFDAGFIGRHPPDAVRAAWTRFCLRQADHVVVMVRPGTALPPPWIRQLLRGCDLVFVCDPLAPVSGLDAWLDALAPRSHDLIGMRDTNAPVGEVNLRRVARRLTGTSTGVVLSGGGARALAHIGALAALEDAGVVIDRIGGSSMGAFISGLYAMGLGFDEMIEVSRRELVERKPFADYTVPRYALIRGRRGLAMLQRVFGPRSIEEMPMPWFCVSSDLANAEVVVHRRGPIIDAIQASISLPGLAPPILRGRRLLVDGAILDNLPVEVMAETGEGPVIGVDVMRTTHANAPPMLPGIHETMTRAAMLGSNTRAVTSRSAAQMVISPDLADVQLLDWRQMDRIVEAGRVAAQAALKSHGPG